MKKPTTKLSFKTETVRSLTGGELALVAGGSRVSIVNPGGPVMTITGGGTSVITPGTSVISHNPSGGLPSGH